LPKGTDGQFLSLSGGLPVWGSPSVVGFNWYGANGCAIIGSAGNIVGTNTFRTSSAIVQNKSVGSPTYSSKTQLERYFTSYKTTNETTVKLTIATPASGDAITFDVKIIGTTATGATLTKYVRGLMVNGTLVSVDEYYTNTSSGGVTWTAGVVVESGWLRASLTGEASTTIHWAIMGDILIANAT
jgi:hypothetical protein